MLAREEHLGHRYLVDAGTRTASFAGLQVRVLPMDQPPKDAETAKLGGESSLHGTEAE